MMVALPLFQNAELNRLQARREALLKRVQNLPPYSTGRPMVIYRLQQVTAQIMRIETELNRRHH